MGRTFTRTSRSSGDTGGRVTFKRGQGKGRGGGTTPTPTEPPADTTPDAISFTPVTGAELSTVTASNNVTPTGFDASVPLTVDAGVEYSLDNGSTWASVDTVFPPGTTLKVHLTSSANPLTPVTKGGSLGGVAFTFTVTTKDTTPPAGTLVSTASELQTALTAAVDGDVIRVAAGDYPFTLISGKVFGTDVTIKANDANDKPVFAGLHFKSCTHIKVQDIEATMSAAPRYGIAVMNCTDMTVTGCLARGNSADVFAADAHGIWLRSSQRITVSNSECKWLEFGLAHLDCDTVTIDGNDFHDIESDGIRGGGTDNITINGNRFYDFYPLTGHHPDYIQFWTTNVVGLTRNITVTNNLGYRGAGEISQGIFFRDQIAQGYLNITVTGNAMVGCMPHGIGVFGALTLPAEGVVVNDNFVLGFSDQRSWLAIGGSTGASYADNEYSFVNHTNNVDLTDGGGNVKLTEATAPGDYTLLDAWLATHTDVPARA